MSSAVARSAGADMQHGIEFASVGGDPAELMQMCVDNGMFTISFMKEGLQKVSCARVSMPADAPVPRVA